MADFLAKTERKKLKTYCPIADMYFLRSFCKKNTSVYVQKPRRKIGQSFGERLRSVEEVLAFLRTWKYFERNSKKIIEFACRMM